MAEMNNKKAVKSIMVPVVILALSLLIGLKFKDNTAVAADDGEYDVVNNSYSHVGIEDMDVTMENGIITIIARSKAADKSTRIRYQTIGFGVSESYQENRVSTKGYTGPAAPANVGVILLSEGQKEDLGIDTQGYQRTKFTFDADSVNKEVGFKLQSITRDKKIYLNAVFQTYYLEDDNSRTIRKGKGRNRSDIGIRTWQEMMEAESWGVDTLKGFEKYYNCEIIFSPGPQHNYYYYDYPNERKLYQGALTDKSINETVEFSTKVHKTSIDDSGKEYALTGYYINRKSDGVRITGAINIPGDLDTVYNAVVAASGKTKVPLGGLDVHIVYDKATTEDTYDNYVYVKYKGATYSAVKLSGKEAGTEIKIGDQVPACKAVLNNKYAGKEFDLIGYSVQPIKAGVKLDSKTVPSMYVGIDGRTEANILAAQVKVVVGGIKIYLEYADTGDVPTPPPIPTTEPKPTLPPLEYPDGGYDNKPIDNFTITGEIRADLRGQERFNVLQGIPTTESLYTQVRGNQYNLGYYLNKKVVMKEYPITVQKDFILTWTDAKDKTKVMEETVPVKQTITVKRVCAYWEISYLDYYTISKAVIYNKALPGGSSTMYPNSSYYRPPVLIVHHMEREEDHIIKPPQAADGYVIMLDPEELQGDGVKPTIPSQDFTYEANAGTEEMKIINDYLSFGGTVVLNGGTYTKEAPDLTNTGVLKEAASFTSPDALYKPDQVIPATILNEQYPSSGTITYVNHPNAVNPSSSTIDLQVNGVNPVIVHTPVICDASITTANTTTGITSNDPYVQALNVDQGCVQLVLDTDSNLSDFTVDISNYGSHLGYPGYFTRDFAWGLRDNTVSYIAKYNDIYRNEVKFPFDVFYRNPSGKSEFISKNTWMRFGHSTPTFYLPMWVNEGTYTVDFRTIAVNGMNSERQLSKTQAYANTDRSNYVATDTVRVQVSGRLYGLTLYDVTDYPTWETVFRIKTGSARLKMNEGYPSGVKSTKYNEGYAYDYKVGLKDQYGNDTGRLERFTLPLVNGSHPKINNVGVLKTGYAVKFKVTTIGNAFSSGDTVTVKPRFYYVDSEGKNRREVDVYYNEYFNNKSYRYVRIGSALDQTNIKKYRCGDQWLAIPDKQLKMMADIKKISIEKYKWQDVELFTYSAIRMTSPLMTYVNTDYLVDLKAGDQYSKIQATGITDSDIVNRMQTYYAEYFLPADIFLVEKGYDVAGYMSKFGVSNHEFFWLKGGYLIINFDIYTTRGITKNLSYLNTINAEKGYCSMWNKEGAVSGKVSYNSKRDPSTIFLFQPGDFMIYYTDKSVKDDYVTYIID